MADGTDYAASRSQSGQASGAATVDLSEHRRRNTPEPITFKRRERDRILQV